MEMEIGEEFIMGANDRALVVKGRRTNRHRSSSPYKAGLTASSSSSGCRKEEESGQKQEVVVEKNCSVFSSTTTSSDVYESTEEEEDMANCLILLAQGDGPRQARKITTNTTITPSFTYTSSSGISKMARKSSDFATSSSVTNTNKVGFYVYECKTCNRSFPSFQALGGHRASHKKPKLTADQETTKKPPPPSTSCLSLLVDNIKLEDYSLNKTSPYCPNPKDDHLHVSLQIGTPSNTTNLNPNKGHQRNNINKVAKVHECSICGSEFNSGQALGGHMRRHRTNTANNGTNTIVTQVGLSGNRVTGPTVEEVASNNNNLNGQDHRTIKPKTVLSLDLNLPAPEDDHYQHQREPKFEFVTAKQALVFSASTLVDCHY